MMKQETVCSLWPFWSQLRVDQTYDITHEGTSQIIPLKEVVLKKNVDKVADNTAVTRDKEILMRDIFKRFDAFLLVSDAANYVL